MVIKKGEPMDIQKFLDDILAKNEELQKWVSRLWYIGEGDEYPPGVTQVLRLSSVASPDERGLTIGIEAVAPYGFYLDAILSLIATAPVVPSGTPKR